MKFLKKLLSVFLAAALTVSAAPMSAAAEGETIPTEEMIEVEETKAAEVDGFFDSAVDLEPMSAVTKTSYDVVEGTIYYRITIPTFGAVQFRVDDAKAVTYYGIMNPETDYVVSNRQTYSFLNKNYYLYPGTYYLRIWQDSGYISYKNLFYSFTPIASPKITSVYPGNGSAYLSWKPVDGATKYAIYVYTGGKYRLYRATTANAYTVSDLNNGTSYGFLVRAYIDGKWTTYNVYDKVNAIPKA